MSAKVLNDVSKTGKAKAIQSMMNIAEMRSIFFDQKETAVHLFIELAKMCWTLNLRI